MAEAGLYFGVFELGQDPEVVTQSLGLIPTRTWRKGDPTPGRPDLRRTHERWELRSPADGSKSLGEQLEALLPLLEDRRSAVQEIVSRFEAGICYIAHLGGSNYNPELHLSAPLIERLAALGLSLDLDLYCLE
jgi:uncharacterized protein DUF4279